MTTADARLEFKPSPIHGTGAFAREPLDRGERVLEYVGERITKEESNRRCAAGNDGVFYLDERFNLDGRVAWNPARFLNHSCAPNCDAELIAGRLWIVARRDIAPGEELVFDYGYDLEDAHDYPCRCGAARCRGCIVAEVFGPLPSARSAGL